MDKKLLGAITELMKTGYSTGRTFHKLVATAGKPEKLTVDSEPCGQLLVKALKANTGYIEVGFDGASTLIGRGHELAPHLVIPIDDVEKVWIDSTVNGEGVSVIVMV